MSDGIYDYQCGNCGKKVGVFQPTTRSIHAVKNGKLIEACASCKTRLDKNRVREAGWRVNPGRGY